MSQTGDLAIVEILPRQKVEQERESPQGADGPGEPRPPGPHIEQDETDERDDEHEAHNVEPAQRSAEVNADAHMSKPFELDDLVACVNSVARTLRPE